MEQPIVLCGLGRIGIRVLEFLQAAGLPVVAIDTVCQLDDPRLRGGRLVRGDCRRREVLEAAGVANARGVLILTGDDLLNVTTTLMVRAVNPDVRIVLRMFNQNLMDRLGKAIKNVFALSTSMLTAPVVAVTALTGQGLGTFRMEGLPDGRRQVADLRIGPGSPLRGQKIVQAAGSRMLVVAHIPSGGSPRFLLDVDLEATLETGDQLMVCGEPRLLAGILGGEEKEKTGLLYASWLRRQGRVMQRTFDAIDKAVTLCTAILLAVVLISTLVFHLNLPDFPLAKSFFRTISVMATGASMHEEEYRDFPRIMVFVSSLRVMGAILIAAFTAIVTNYLLRARLGGALEISRIPESGHIIVCGLGPVGFRVVEELAANKQPVVVIELAADNRFVATVRRLKVPVIIGDAAVLEVLRQAHAGSARAVVAATNNDLANIEVTLLVRELNSTQRIVLLLSDQQLAQMLRDAAHVDLAVSVPALSAPAFLAGLYGDRVHCVFLVRHRMLAVLDLLIQPQDALAGLAVRAVAVDYNLMPVALLRAQGPPSSQPLGARLGPGDRLVAMIALPDLERLFRRQPAATGYGVEVSSFPLPTRGWLVGLIRTEMQLGAEEAERALDHLPMRMRDDLTHGQAEDLLARLVRERVTARLCPPHQNGMAEPKAPIAIRSIP